MAEICVVGAGVSGLTTAIELIERKHSVCVIADATGPDTTSSAAAAFWYPFWTGAEPDHSWYRYTWAWESFLRLDQLADYPSAGITRTRLIEYFDETMTRKAVDAVIDSMWWRLMRRVNFQLITREQIENASIGDTRFQAGTTFETLVINMSCYLPFLESMFLAKGGQLVREHIKANDLVGLCNKFKYVVNCTGLGSRVLVGEGQAATEANAPAESTSRDQNSPQLISKEGIVVRVAPVKGVDDVLLVHTGAFDAAPVYIVPRGGPNPDIVLGGTIEINEGHPRHFAWAWQPNNAQDEMVRAVAEVILQSCYMLKGTLRSAEKLGVSVGYRPARKPMVRLEPELSGFLAGRLIHNYGHGGGGVTLSWGCAKEVADWIDWLN